MLRNLIKKVLTEEIRQRLSLMMKMATKKDLIEAHKVSAGEFVELYRDDDFILTVPLTHNASRKYGSGTKWCTTKKECDQDFKNHIKLGVLGYIVIRNDELKQRFKNNAFALYRLFNSDRFIAFDDQNTEYRNGDAWLSNEFDKKDKLFQYYKMLSKFNDYYNSKNQDNLTENILGKKPLINESSRIEAFKSALLKQWSRTSNPRIDLNLLKIMGFYDDLPEFKKLYLEYVGGEDVALKRFDDYITKLEVTDVDVRRFIDVDPNDKYTVNLTGIYDITDDTPDYKAFEYGFYINDAHVTMDGGVVVDIDDLDGDDYFDVESALRSELDTYVLLLSDSFGLSFNDATSVWND